MSAYRMCLAESALQRNLRQWQSHRSQWANDLTQYGRVLYFLLCFPSFHCWLGNVQKWRAFLGEIQMAPFLLFSERTLKPENLHPELFAFLAAGFWFTDCRIFMMIYYKFCFWVLFISCCFIVGHNQLKFTLKLLWSCKTSQLKLTTVFLTGPQKNIKSILPSANENLTLKNKHSGDSLTTNQVLEFKAERRLKHIEIMQPGLRMCYCFSYCYTEAPLPFFLERGV